ncbi:hypothetical protein [Microbacterium sp. LWH10-1.2]|uniref:hypothetical protein n=1 Tax=Microbacterium sp. LWH10-1.2 TaxID=3135255 RepID=UPI00313921AB
MADEREVLSEVFTDFSRKRDALKENPNVGIDEIALLPLVEVWVRLLEWAETAKLPDDAVRHVATAAREAYTQQNVYRQVAGNAKRQALSGVDGNLDVFFPIFNALAAPAHSTPKTDALKGFIKEAREESRRSSSVMAYVTQRTSGLEEAVRDASEAAGRAEAALELAEKAATKSATSTLERSFETTANKNARSAFWFRTGTITTLVGTVALGVYYAVDSPTHPADDWRGLVYRVAILSALAGVAAYLGRQASHYHRIATWALGIEIQLKAFRGFVNEIDDPEARQTMFTLFGKRVLEAPPDGKSGNDEVTNVIQPIIEHATRYRPSSPPSTPGA